MISNKQRVNVKREELHNLELNRIDRGVGGTRQNLWIVLKLLGWGCCTPNISLKNWPTNLQKTSIFKTHKVKKTDQFLNRKHDENSTSLLTKLVSPC